MPVEHPDHTNEDEERGHINQYHERLVDMSEDGEIYLQLKLTEDGKAPDESKGTFVVIPLARGYGTQWSAPRFTPTKSLQN